MADKNTEIWQAYLQRSIGVLQDMLVNPQVKQVEQAIAAMAEAASKQLPIMVCGNGGSAADAMHITAELVGRFLAERQALNAICLSSNPSVLTAWANDYDYESVFSRQVEAHARPGAVIVGLSTSGNSENVIRAFQRARELDCTTIALTGEGGRRMAEYSDVLISAPTTETPLVQQVHICIYHYLCMEVERRSLATG